MLARIQCKICHCLHSKVIYTKVIYNKVIRYTIRSHTTIQVPQTAAAPAAKGDILSIAASKNRVFTSGADGSIRSWSVSKRTGDMTEGPVVERAHEGRVAGIMLHKDILYSVSFDGAIKVGPVARAGGDPCAALAKRAKA